VAEPARKALTAGETVPLRSKRFGDFDIPADRVLEFPEGLIGFPEARRFALLESSKPGSPFRCLVSLDIPDLGFVVCEPAVLWPGYGDDLPKPSAWGATEVAVMAIVTVPKNAQEMTANLMAPILVDCRSRTGCQLVLDTGRYSTRHTLLGAVAARSATPPAQP
jgi:flagellar assembly factor FliW